MTASKQRDSSLELLRIIAMLAIIAFHFETQTAIVSAPLDSWPSFFAMFLGSFGRSGVNVFILIGAWFLIDLPFRSIRFVRLYLTTLFYTVTVSLAILLLNANPQAASLKNLIFAFSPFSSSPLWFVSCYLFLLLLSPFLNTLIRSLSPRRYRILYWILLIVFVFLPTVENLLPGFSVYERYVVKSDMSYMVALYLIAGFWKKIREPFFADRNRAGVCILALIAGCAALCLAVCFAGRWDIQADYPLRKLHSIQTVLFRDLGSVFCIGMAGSVFFLFRSFHFPAPAINRIARNTLGIYVLHQVPCVVPVMWSCFHIERWRESPCELGVIAAIFIGCWLIDCLREWMMSPVYRAAWMQRSLAKADSLFAEEEDS
jgi:surface polysaccharide O-acyltransferase-like enzyme